MDNNIKKAEDHNKKKFNFAEKKENTVNSLFEVEHFLNNLKHTLKCINLYKFLK